LRPSTATPPRIPAGRNGRPPTRPAWPSGRPPRRPGRRSGISLASSARGTFRPIENRRDRQQTPALVGVLRRRGKPPKLISCKVRSNRDRCWHGADPPRAMKSAQPATRNPGESEATAAGIIPAAFTFGRRGCQILSLANLRALSRSAWLSFWTLLDHRAGHSPRIPQLLFRAKRNALLAPSSRLRASSGAANALEASSFLFDRSTNLASRNALLPVKLYVPLAHRSNVPRQIMFAIRPSGRRLGGRRCIERASTYPDL